MSQSDQILLAFWTLLLKYVICYDSNSPWTLLLDPYPKIRADVMVPCPPFMVGWACERACKVHASAHLAEFDANFHYSRFLCWAQFCLLHDLYWINNYCRNYFVKTGVCPTWSKLSIKSTKFSFQCLFT